MQVAGRSGDLLKMSLPPMCSLPLPLVLTVGVRLARAGLTPMNLLNGCLLWNSVVVKLISFSSRLLKLTPGC
jgi:hypothetical protein